MTTTKEEQAILAALRRLRAAEARPPEVPPELLEHGMTSLARTAAVLGFKGVADLKAQRWGGCHGEGLPLMGGKVPTSEVFIEWKRLQRVALERLGDEVIKLVTVAGLRCWGRWDSITPWLPQDLEPYDAAGVAEELEVSKAEAKRLMAGPLFASKRRRWRVPVVTREELQAYQRAHPQPVQRAAA